MAVAVPQLAAQTVETIPFRMNMSPRNEVPALDLNATGFGTVLVHVVRDAAGRVTSGTVDFSVRYTFPEGITITGFHIHKGDAGINGPVLIDTRLSAANNIVDATGKGSVERPVEVPAGSANVAVLEDLIANPSTYYLNMHTTVNPGGAIRAQMVRAERRVFGVLMKPENEIPAIANSEASAYGFATILAAFENGALSSSEVTFDMRYSGFAEGTQFTGMHIHTGTAAVNGAVTIDTTLSRAQNIFAGPGGAGTLKYVVDANLAQPATVSTILDIWNNPALAYWNLHTVTNPGGEIRAQLRSTEVVSFTARMTPANEVPAIAGLDAIADTTFTAHLLRRPDGGAMSAYGVFDANVRFPGATTFTGMHIHNGAAGINGPVTLDSGLSATATVPSETGVGNIYRTAILSTQAQVDGLNNVLDNPENNYLNIHTMVYPGGAVRSQIAAVNAVRPSIETVISSVSDPAYKSVALGGLMTIYGTNISKLAGGLDGWEGGVAPRRLNGTSVEVSGKDAAVLQVSPRLVIAQVPFEATTGDTELVVKNTNGASAIYRLNVSRVAPAVFFDQISADGYRVVAYDIARGTQIGKDSPAAGGTFLSVYGTGFGQSTPALATGQVAGFTMLARYPDIKVTVGGRLAEQAVAVLIPGYVGLVQTNFVAPSGLSGPQAFEIDYLGAKSNKTILYMR